MSEPNYALTYVEIDVDYCALTYGTAPCTAALGVTGDIKCFNTLALCQDRAHFTNAPVTLRFAVATDYLPADIETIAPSVVSVDYSPGVISLGEDLGQRASLSATFTDHRSSDTGPGGDKYVSERDYAPFAQGTFWGKFRKRQNFLRGRPMRWIQGLVGQDIADMDTRHFVIESFDGPGLDGRFTITAKDPLKLLDGDRAQAPVLSKGFLNADITSVATAATLSPSGIGNANYPASGYIAIGGKEIVAFTRSGDSLTLTRARFNTVAVAHNAGDRCQLCLVYTAQDPADVIADLEENYAGVDSDWIPLPAWQAETAAYYRRVVTACIAEPTSVKRLVSELIQQCGLAHWWAEDQQLLRLQVLRTIPTTAERFDEDNTATGTLRVTEQPDKRVSQVWVYFGQFNPLKSVDDTDNYRSAAILEDTDAEADYGSPAIKPIFSRWIPFGGLTVAQRLTEIQLGRFRTAPRRFAFNLFRHGAASPELGEGCRLQGLPMQEATGAAEDVPIQITRLGFDDGYFMAEAEEMIFVDLNADDPNTHAIIIDANSYDIDLRELHDTLYASIAAGMTVNVTVNAGVIVGSTSTATPAFDVGTWPTQAVTGNRTSGSPIISGLSVNTATWAKVGQRVFGTGIPAGAKILSIDSSSQVTLTANASSGAGTSTALTVHTVIINLYLRGRVQGKGGRGGDSAGVAHIDSDRDGGPGGAGGLALYTRYGINLDLSSGAGAVFAGGGGGGGTSLLYFSNGGAGGGGAGSQPGAAGLVDAAGVEYMDIPATAGTTEAGGHATDSSTFPGTFNAGVGGAPGMAGVAGYSYGGAFNGGAGGAAGVSIDGVSYVVKTGTGDIRGAEVN